MSVVALKCSVYHRAGLGQGGGYLVTRTQIGGSGSVSFSLVLRGSRSSNRAVLWRKRRGGYAEK